jgi:SAM-dependent methyltransferase
MNAIVKLRTPSFGDWAQAYQRFRPTYPASVFSYLCELVGERRNVCVELGAGTGQATGDLLPLFGEVMAVEPDAAMARLIPPDPRLTISIERGEDVRLPSACVDAVVAAAALHWMDEAAILGAARDWLRPGGVFFAFGFGPPQYPGARTALATLLGQLRRDQRSHEHARLTGIRPYRETLKDSGVFATTGARETYASFVWTPLELAGYLASTSGGQARARASGDAARHGDLLADAIALAARGPIQVRFPVEIAYGVTGPAIS